MSPLVAGAENEVILRVASRSGAQTLGAAISHAMYDNKTVTIHAIGAGAVNQAIKAIAIARGYVAQRGIDLAIVPGFLTKQIKGEDVSAIALRVVTL